LDSIYKNQSIRSRIRGQVFPLYMQGVANERSSSVREFSPLPLVYRASPSPIASALQQPGSATHGRPLLSARSQALSPSPLIKSLIVTNLILMWMQFTELQHVLVQSVLKYAA
jgi:hypothetical protein